MINIHALSWFDLAVFILFIFFMLRGGWVGFMRQLGGLLALAGGYVLAAKYTSTVLPYAQHLIINPKLVFFFTFLGLFFAAALAISLLASMLHRLMQVTMLGWFNRLLGVALGATKAAIIASFAYMLLASTMSATNSMLKDSFTTPFLRQGATLLKSCINDPKLRAYFEENVPAIPLEFLQEKNEQKTASPAQSASSNGSESPAAKPEKKEITAPN